jgi:DNA-binding cell septation regulator SpoVG
MSDEPATLECKQISVVVERLSHTLKSTSCKAFAKVTFKTDVGEISIDNFRVIEAKDKLYVVPPSHKSKSDNYYDDVKVTGDLLKMLRGAVLRQYHRTEK